MLKNFLFNSVKTVQQQQQKYNLLKSFYCVSRPSVTTLSDEETILRDSVRGFTESYIRPKVQKMDENSEMDPEVIKKCFEQGFMGLEIPEEYGGSGLSFFDACLVVEEIARVDPSVSVMVDVQNTLINTAINKWGNKEQQERYFPRLATNTLSSFCLSEAGSGSDAFSLRTRAEKDGDHFIINGSKMWITNAKEANLFLVMANVSPKDGYKGITAFFVERDNPGLTINPPEKKMGLCASSTCAIEFNDCKVHKTDILGEIGKGYKIAIESLNEGRIGIGSQQLGLAQGAFDLTMPYIMERKQFNNPIARYQAVQHQFARCHVDIEAARVLVYNAARKKLEGSTFVEEASMAKLVASEVAEKVSSQCINLLGGVGFTRDMAVEKYFRDCKVGQIYEGTTNIQLQTIAKEVLRKYQ
eukprot:TRINITY_DN537_c0_g3_i1.p1 TRINITY_DN537_c0_g3~~TRINITY_DN537_c0_g3_i1.p1  ORF type:complete len:414 (-),score=159.30 TRINITY_DN537_c0_g3_i1:122-1363(-)